MTISFDRSLCPKKADFLENFSGTLLLPFHVTFGRVFTVSEDMNHFNQKKISLIARIAAGILLVALLPLTLPLALLGFALSKLSSSYSAVYGIYLSSVEQHKKNRLIHPGELTILETLHKGPLTKQQIDFASSAKALALELQGGDEKSKLLSLSRFIKNSKKLENGKTLAALKEDLTQIVGAQLAEECSKDPDIIGLDVLENRALLTKERHQLVVKKVKELHKDVASIKEALPELKKELKAHLPCTEEMVHKMHPEFSGLPLIGGKTGEDLIQEYNGIINQALIEAEIKLKRRHRGGATEKNVLQNLGYKINGAYDNLDIAKEAMTSIYQKLSKKGEITKPTTEFRENLTHLATMMRYQLAGVPETTCMAVHAVIEKVHSLDSTLTQLMVTPFKELKESHYNSLDLLQNNLPKASQKMQAKKKHLLTLEKNARRNDFVKGLKPLLHKNLNSDELELELNRRCEAFAESVRSNPNVDEDAIESALAPNFEFNRLFLKPGVNVVEYSQGEEGLGTVLGTGVCMMMCFELDKELIKDPGMTFETLHLDQIDPEVRYNQAMYKLLILNQQIYTCAIPEPVLKKSNMRQEPFSAMRAATLENIERMFAKIQDQSEELQENNPALEIGFSYKDGGHALFIRFDKDRGRYIFRDPNFLTAEYMTDDPEKGMDWLKQILNVLLLKLYPETATFAATNIIPK